MPQQQQHQPVEYPKWMHHATEGSKIVHSEQEEQALGSDWVDHKDKLQNQEGDKDANTQSSAAAAGIGHARNQQEAVSPASGDVASQVSGNEGSADQQRGRKK